MEARVKGIGFIQVRKRDRTSQKRILDRLPLKCPRLRAYITTG